MGSTGGFLEAGLVVGVGVGGRGEGGIGAGKEDQGERWMGVVFFKQLVPSSLFERKWYLHFSLIFT